MNKFYSRLHTVNSNFKKQFLRISLFVFLVLHIGTNANAQCNVNPVANQTVCNNATTAAINFTGTATTFNWTNNTASIGLAASGTGNIASFTALNTSATAITATVIVTPSTGACTGTSISFTITVNPSPNVIASPNSICGGPCNSLTASGADMYTWSPLSGLYTDCPPTQAYTGTSLPTVYTVPINYNLYTVTGTNSTTGCMKTVMAIPNYTPPAPVIIPPSVFMCLGDPAVRLNVVTTSGTLPFCSGLINVPVPDNNLTGASSSIAVAGIPVGCTITGMTVAIYMPHTRIGNMVFVLRAPNGQVMNLDYHLSGTGGTGPTTGFVNTIISSTGTVALSAGTNPYTGTFRPDLINTPGAFGPAGPTGMLPTATNWSSLYSVPNGNWTLGFYDGITGDVGNLTYWCLNFTYSCGSITPATPGVWFPPTGLYLDPACTVPYQVGTPTNAVWTRPFPAGVYTYQVTTEGVPGPPVAFANPAAISIPVGGVAALYPSDITVSGLPTSGVRVRSIVLHGVSHTRSNDIDIVLQSPSGQNVILMSDVGGANAINATYTFIDWQPFMSSTAANLTGTYKPSNAGQPDNFPPPGPGSILQNPSLSMFTGNYNGTWKLFVVDDDGTGDQGIISGGYTINFDIVTACTSPPGSVVVTVGLSTTITAQPQNTTVCSDGLATFSVNVAGTGPYTYQWQVSTNGPWNNIIDGGVYSGTTTATLTVTAPPVSMSGYYYRVIVNGTAVCGTTNSAPAILTVKPLPDIVITANPLIIGPGQTTTIFSTVTPSPAATYTWYFNGAVLPGATADTMLVDVNALGDYQLKVTDVNGCTNFSNIISIAHSFAITAFTYPNPSGGIFQLRYHSETNTSVQRSLTVYNNKGEKIMRRTFTQTIPYQIIDIDIRANGKGLYWIELRDAAGKRLAINRVVVQ